MTDWSAALTMQSFSFGPFHLIPEQQVLLCGETQVHVGSRALEILVALVERHGELISKDELISRAWPDTSVEESNLKVHIAALRKVLGESQSGPRYIATASGRGYRFVAPVETSKPNSLLSHETITAGSVHNLPTATSRIIGRDETVDALLQQLPLHRLVTVVGAGGIGKTTVALAIAKTLVTNYDDGVWFIDLAPLGKGRVVPGALAAALGLTVESDRAIVALISYLRNKRMLVVLDSCEHLIDEVAVCAEQIIANAPNVHILATSREPLRVKGEKVYRLPPLASPSDSFGLTAAEALTYPAVELFVERAAAGAADFKLNDIEAPIVADICRQLDGIALAIELAATRVDAFGVRTLSTLLDDRFRLLNQGRRPAPARHQTLAATLDWSYEFLSEGERTILRRLSVFAGTFSLESASAVAADNSISAADVIVSIANLVAKSLVSPSSHGTTRYRLLDTTRAYARQKLLEKGEFQSVARRHAVYHRDLFQQAEDKWRENPSSEWLADHTQKIDDIRSALNWAFFESGEDAIGVALTVAAIPLWVQLSLMDECRIWAERALGSEASKSLRNERNEMKLYASIGTVLTYAFGAVPEAGMAWKEVLRLSERIEDRDYQLRALWGSSACSLISGNYRIALGQAERMLTIVSQEGDTDARLTIRRLMATCLFHLGDLTKAQVHVDHLLSEYVEPVRRSHIARFPLDRRSASRGLGAYLLWIQGYPDQALRMSDRAIEEANATGHPVFLYTVLVHYAFPIALHVGDWDAAERMLATLTDTLIRHPMAVWSVLRDCLQGVLLIEHGDRDGLPILRSALDALRKANFCWRYSAYLGTLARGLNLAGHIDDARTVITEAIKRSERREELWCRAELLRIKGEFYRLEGSDATDRIAEDYFHQALKCARGQKALSWELRAATSVAQLWNRSGNIEKAEKVLSSVYGNFNEGFETHDLKLAYTLIGEFHANLGLR